MFDYQLFAVQPTLMQNLIPGLTCAVYNRDSVVQEVRDPDTNKLNEKATNELTMQVFEVLEEQLDLTNPNATYTTIGAKESLLECNYVVNLLPMFNEHIIPHINFKDQILFIRVDHTLVPNHIKASPKQPSYC